MNIFLSRRKITSFNNSLNFVSVKNLGFTLVELLVVISILAVLAIVGFAAFNNIQKNANDAKRRADIDAIAKVLEINKASGGNYISLSNNQFVSGRIPTDPIGCVGGLPYCYRAAGANPWGAVASICSTTNNPLSSTNPSAGLRWTVCACLESGETYCKSSSQ